jgi:catechol 2,3-dioxygenase-like lactoylglutathione lyase family enzyme
MEFTDPNLQENRERGRYGTLVYLFRGGNLTPKLDMIGLTCKSIPESLRFYRLLGLEVADQPGEPYVETTLPGGIRLSWNDLEMMKQIDSEWEEPKGQRIGLAFLCDSPSAVDELFAKVKSGGFQAHKEPWDAFWGQRYAQVLDPDGNVVDLFAPLG